ncbi:uncharacterized protein LOC142580143 isoform X2 [Dermacentor variabilis]|uniref:uncharacterized protein LOC142580143 isoform X2 n=1 Tax=Dermacentor variabilis TaxID=34621 RepID=UPI003F5C8FF4
MRLRDFLFHVSTSRVRLTNPECAVKTEVLCDRSEPTIEIALCWVTTYQTITNGPATMWAYSYPKGTVYKPLDSGRGGFREVDGRQAVVRCNHLSCLEVLQAVGRLAGHGQGGQ